MNQIGDLCFTNAEYGIIAFVLLYMV